MPSLFSVFGYRIYFWSNENNEPVHVHVSKGKPTVNSTKFWLTKNRGCVLASNENNISNHDLNKLIDIITSQYDYICDKWKEYFDVSDLKFYL